MPDITVHNSGSFVMLVAITTVGVDWCEELLPERQPWEGDGWIVEYCYLQDVLDGMVEDGLEVG